MHIDQSLLQFLRCFFMNILLLVRMARNRYCFSPLPPYSHSSQGAKIQWCQEACCVGACFVPTLVCVFKTQICCLLDLWECPSKDDDAKLLPYWPAGSRLVRTLTSLSFPHRHHVEERSEFFSRSKSNNNVSIRSYHVISSSQSDTWRSGELAEVVFQASFFTCIRVEQPFESSTNKSNWCILHFAKKLFMTKETSIFWTGDLLCCQEQHTDVNAS